MGRIVNRGKGSRGSNLRTKERALRQTASALCSGFSWVEEEIVDGQVGATKHGDDYERQHNPRHRDTDESSYVHGFR
jgi:hypothetical protein